MYYRELKVDEVDRIGEIDGECYIHNAWRMVNGVRQLTTIDWTDHELPNGLAWHKSHFENSLNHGGKAFGCFENDTMIGYAVVNSELFGQSANYVLLDQVFISKNYRGKGIGNVLVMMCREAAKKFGADKLYICAGSSEDTIAFYHKIGCVEATEVNQELYELDNNDIQLEFVC